MNKHDKIKKALDAFAAKSSRTAGRSTAALGDSLRRRLHLLVPYIGRPLTAIPGDVWRKVTHVHGGKLPRVKGLQCPSEFNVPVDMQKLLGLKYLTLDTVFTSDLSVEVTPFYNGIILYGSTLKARDWWRAATLACAFTEWGQSPLWGAERSESRHLRMVAKAAKV